MAKLRAICGAFFLGYCPKINYLCWQV